MSVLMFQNVGFNFPKQYEFDDLKKHWAKKPAQRVTNLGLMQPKIKKQDILFNPKDRMTYQEASSALVWMYYLDQLIAPSQHLFMSQFRENLIRRLRYSIFV